MKSKLSLLAQITQLIPRSVFNQLVKKHGSDYGCKGFNSWTHFISLLFCHLSQAPSLRDICNGLRSTTGNLNHLGIERAPTKSSLSYNNNHRDWELFRDFYQELLTHFKTSHTFPRKGLHRIKRKVFLMDATTIPLCLKVFDWATFRRRKGAIKLHLTLDYDGCLPHFATVSEGNIHDINPARRQSYPPGSVLVFDRAYVDYQWLHILDSSSVYFVTRAKKNMDYEVIKQHPISDGDSSTVFSDETIELAGVKSGQAYPRKFRRVAWWDAENQKELVFITNNLYWTASTVAAIYKERWHIEVFFKYIKQYLRVKSFVGTSVNAVMIQLWTALITMLLLSLLRATATYQWHLSNMVTFLRMNLFAKINLQYWLNTPWTAKDKPPGNQLSLDM